MENLIIKQAKQIQELEKFAAKYGGYLTIVEKLKDHLVENRFLITGKLSEGAFGLIFQAIDTHTCSKKGHGVPTIIKFS